MHCVLQQMALKKARKAVISNKYSLYRIHKLPSFYIKTNLRESRIFAARWTFGGQKRHSEC